MLTENKNTKLEQNKQNKQNKQNNKQTKQTAEHTATRHLATECTVCQTLAFLSDREHPEKHPIPLHPFPGHLSESIGLGNLLLKCLPKDLKKISHQDCAVIQYSEDRVRPEYQES